MDGVPAGLDSTETSHVGPLNKLLLEACSISFMHVITSMRFTHSCPRLT
jgi:hypothetical protein